MDPLYGQQLQHIGHENTGNLACPLPLAWHLSLRVQQLDVRCETKTKDNVFVNVVASIQYRAPESKVNDAFYKLTNARTQIQAYVFDVIRASVPKLLLVDAFEQKNEIAKAVEDELEKALSAYGYEIVQTLIVDIEPDENVKRAMNEINAVRSVLAGRVLAKLEELVRRGSIAPRRSSVSPNIYVNTVNNIERITLNDYNDHMVAKVEGGFTLCDKCNLKAAEVEGGFTPCDNCETDIAEIKKRKAKANIQLERRVKFHESLIRSEYNEVENTSADHAMTFSDKDLPPEGTSHPSKLYISVDFGEKPISRVLIDSGSDFNICPLEIVRKLGVEERIDKCNIMVARGFDGTQRKNIGQIELPLRVGSITFPINFHVFDIPCTSYNLILGAAWINEAKVLHSSVHQRLKFVVNNKTITVHAQKDFAVSFNTAGEPSSKRRLEIIMVSHMPERSQPPQPRFSNKTIGESSDTIICGGPISVFEFEKYAAETEEEANELADLDLSEEGVTTIT